MAYLKVSTPNTIMLSENKKKKKIMNGLLLPLSCQLFFVFFQFTVKHGIGFLNIVVFVFTYYRSFFFQFKKYNRRDSPRLRPQRRPHSSPWPFGFTSKSVVFLGKRAQTRTFLPYFRPRQDAARKTIYVFRQLGQHKRRLARRVGRRDLNNLIMSNNVDIMAIGV